MAIASAIKVCGFTRGEDVAAVAAMPAVRYAGVVLVPGSPRFRPVAEAARTLAGWPRMRVGVFVDAAEREVAEAAEAIGLHVLQFHGAESVATVRSWRRRGWIVWKAVRVRRPDDVRAAVDSFGDEADLLLLDSWSPRARGGTGATFPWETVADLLASLPTRPAVGVAGGLTPANVGQAIAALRPQLVDVSSGVESAPGTKDPERVAAFVAAVVAATTVSDYRSRCSQ
jgi:phosphoribosylanthranilate isomerase